MKPSLQSPISESETRRATAVLRGRVLYTRRTIFVYKQKLLGEDGKGGAAPADLVCENWKR